MKQCRIGGLIVFNTQCDTSTRYRHLAASLFDYWYYCYKVSLKFTTSRKFPRVVLIWSFPTVWWLLFMIKALIFVDFITIPFTNLFKQLLSWSGQIWKHIHRMLALKLQFIKHQTQKFPVSIRLLVFWSNLADSAEYCLRKYNKKCQRSAPSIHPLRCLRHKRGRSILNGK